MKQAYVLAAAAVVVAGSGLSASARAECSPDNPTACAPSAQHAGKPLALHPTRLGSARASVSRAGVRHHPTAHRATKKAIRTAAKIHRAPPALDAATGATTTADSSAQQPRMVATVPITAPAVAFSSERHASGFATPQQPWSSVSAFAATEQPLSTSPRTWASTLPGNMKPTAVKIVPSNQVNEIDLAADSTNPGKARFADMSPAKAAEQAPSAAESVTPTQSAAAHHKESWSGWLYRICAGTFDAAASAVKAALM